jgi:cation diffusion facilitator CzcD-associated flavoprotein CzcO
MHNVVNCDVLVVGAGLSGIAALYKLRKLGLNVKVVETGSEFGGTWFWNKYPGARVDSEFPFYQLNFPEAWKDWNFTQRFPDRAELCAYFKHVDETCDLRKDTYFNTRAYDMSWDDTNGMWTVSTDTGLVTKSKYLVLACGSLDKSYTPNFPGLAKFQGETYHSREWPDNANLKGKKVAVIGAGATGIQVVQESAKLASELSVFIRRPSTCLPMVQRDLTEEQRIQQRASYPDLFRESRLSWSGFPLKRGPKIVETSPEDREAIFEETWSQGGFAFLAAFSDTRTDPEANRIVYDFWKKKIRARISDPVKQEILAPTNPLFYFGTKRSPLEQDYYEILNRDSVKLISLRTNPFERFLPNGVAMSDGSTHEFDVLIFATGFESFTGS